MNFNWLLIPSLVLTVILYAVGQKAIRHSRNAKLKRVLTAVFFLSGIPALLFPLYYLHLLDHAIWYYEFRALPFIELSAAGAGLSASALLELLKGSRIFTKPVILLLMTTGIAIPYLKPILRPQPQDTFSNRWKDGVCLQSTPASCGAASAATIFKMYGENIQETDLAKECFTCTSGTENWHIVRAFRKRGFSVRYRIKKEFPSDLKTPAIAGVRLGNIGHFITILEKTKDVYITGDPLRGRQIISEEQLSIEFDFTGFFMEIGAPRT